MTGSRIAAGSVRASVPSHRSTGEPLLPTQRVVRAAGPRPATDGGLRTAPGASAETRTQPAAGRMPGLRALLVHPDPASTHESTEALTAAGFSNVIVAASTDGAVVEPPPDPRSDVAAVAVETAPDAAIDLGALRRHGWQRIVAIVVEPDTDTTTAALRHGATGAVWAGGSPQAAEHVPSGVYDLSTREVEVLRMVADGRANKWIGDQLDLSALTVKSHLARIGRKLGTGERAHMVMLALRAGVIS